MKSAQLEYVLQAVAELKQWCKLPETQLTWNPACAQLFASKSALHTVQHCICAIINAMWWRSSPVERNTTMIYDAATLDVQVARQLLQQLLQTVMRMTGTYPRPREVGLYENLASLFCMLAVFLTSVLSNNMCHLRVCICSHCGAEPAERLLAFSRNAD